MIRVGPDRKRRVLSLFWAHFMHCPDIRIHPLFITSGLSITMADATSRLSAERLESLRLNLYEGNL